MKSQESGYAAASRSVRAGNPLLGAQGYLNVLFSAPAYVNERLPMREPAGTRPRAKRRERSAPLAPSYTYSDRGTKERTQAIFPPR